MTDSGLIDELILAHRIVGYVTAFAVAPLALVAFAAPQRHRLWGKLFVALMSALYLTGLLFTFHRHEIGSFVWLRNLAFNFLGFYFVLLGWRAVWRYSARALQPAALDHAMRAVLFATSLLLAGLGARHHFPSLVFGVIGLWFAIAAFREPLNASALYRIHQRCMLAAFFYVLTVLSLVHVQGRGDIRWLWPTLVGLPLVVYATREAEGAGPRMRRAVWSVLGVAYVLGVYIIFLGK